jgi:hypothetical protein
MNGSINPFTSDKADKMIFIGYKDKHFQSLLKLSENFVTDKSDQFLETKSSFDDACIDENVNTQKENEVPNKTKGSTKMELQKTKMNFIWKCDVAGCDYRSKEKPKYTRHRQGHRGALFSCKLCDFTTDHSGNLKRHGKVHDTRTAEGFSCKLCDFATDHEANLRRHVVKSHENSSSQILHCVLCDFKIRSVFVLTNHVKTHTVNEIHNDVEVIVVDDNFSDIICPVADCNHEIVSRMDLTSHIQGLHKGVTVMDISVHLGIRHTGPSWSTRKFKHVNCTICSPATCKGEDYHTSVCKRILTCKNCSENIVYDVSVGEDLDSLMEKYQRVCKEHLQNCESKPKLPDLQSSGSGICPFCKCVFGGVISHAKSMHKRKVAKCCRCGDYVDFLDYSDHKSKCHNDDVRIYHSSDDSDISL